MMATLPIAGVVLALLVAVIAAWGRRRKHRRYGCDVAREAVERLKSAIATGVHFAGFGAFSDDGSEARNAVDAAAQQVVDKKLRQLLLELVTVYDQTKSAASDAAPFDPKWRERAPFRAVAVELDPASPHHRLKALPVKALGRIHFLERKAAAY